MHRSIHTYAHTFCMHAYTYMHDTCIYCTTNTFVQNTYIYAIVACMLVLSLALIGSHMGVYGREEVIVHICTTLTNTSVSKQPRRIYMQHAFTQKLMHIRALMQTHIHMHKHALTRVIINTATQAHTLSHAHTHTHTHTHTTHTHTHTHPHTHTHTPHTHTHTK